MNGEHALSIASKGARLIGVLHAPLTAPAATRAVVVVVGGPQYRVGSHRQFVLLARALAACGTPVLRFDFAGMGDSSGEFAGFERCGADIRAAIDALQAELPQVREVCLWGLCDGASAALMYACEDTRVTHLVLLNPWVRTDAGQAQAYLDAYYGRRLRSAAVWRRMLAEPAAILRAAAGYVANLRRARAVNVDTRQDAHYLSRMLSGAQRFGGRILVLLSGRDLVATEFERMIGRFPAWHAAFHAPRVIVRRLPEATHTFSRRAWRDWATSATAQFVADRSQHVGD